VFNIFDKLLFEELNDENPLSKEEIVLFKFINKNKKNTSSKDDLIDLFKKMMSYIQKPQSDALFYYETYVHNFRPEGDYENLTKSNFKDIRSFIQKKTPNNNAYNYTSGKIPFKGSNLEGYWGVNSKNEKYYIVISYNWYPIYLYIGNTWYRVSNTYSSSTSKQMSHSNPVRYDSGINQNVKLVTPSEIKQIRDGESLENIEKERVTKFMGSVYKTFKNKSFIFSFGYGDDAKKVKFTVDDIVENNDKIKFIITVNKGGKMVDRKMVENPDGYIVPSPFSDDIEKNIKKYVIGKEIDFLSSNNTEFVFKHKN
jgi:hypothetical protein